MDLREKTREVQQSKPALRTHEFADRAKPLEREQRGLTDRTEVVVEKIRQLPGGEAEFGREIRKLEQVADVMAEATGLLRRPETGPATIAAETEAIELLLEARRIGGGGGGSGSSPGRSNATGDTDVSALALAGRGDAPNQRIERREVGQSTGTVLDTVPAELRAALDRYFSGLEKK